MAVFATDKKRWNPKKPKSCQTLISKHVEVPSSVSFQPQICDRRNIPNNVYGHNWSNRVKPCQNHPKPRIEWNNNNFVKTWISSYFFRLHTHVWQGSGGCFDQHRTGFHHPNPRRSKIGQKAWPSTSKNIEMARFECMQVWYSDADTSMAIFLAIKPTHWHYTFFGDRRSRCDSSASDVSALNL